MILGISAFLLRTGPSFSRICHYNLLREKRWSRSCYYICFPALPLCTHTCHIVLLRNSSCQTGKEWNIDLGRLGRDDDDIDLFLLTKIFTLNPGILYPIVKAGMDEKKRKRMSSEEWKWLECERLNSRCSVRQKRLEGQAQLLASVLVHTVSKWG